LGVYLVTYDLNKEVIRPKITEKVRAFDSWAKLSESSYAISTNMTPEQVYNYFKPLLDDNDNLYVITLKRPYAGQGLQEVNDWLNDNLPW
jgi:hypothetical protein